MAQAIIRKLESVSTGSWQGRASWYQMEAQETEVAGREWNLEQSKRRQRFPGGELTIGGQVQGHGNSHHSLAGIKYLNGNLLILLKKDRVGTGLSVTH